MMDEAKVKELLREWIAKKNGKISPQDIQDDTPLLERRIVSSLHVMELVLYLERLRQEPIALDHLQPKVFRDISSLYHAFFTARGQ